MQDKWDARYREADPATARPAQVLCEHRHLLPAEGVALEIACGLGANAYVLAGQGLNTLAWDISGVAIASVQTYADAQGLSIQACQRDVLSAPPTPDSVDVLVVSRFLERSLAPALIAALRANGLLFYQTFIRETVDEGGPANVQFRLAPNELLRLFAPLQVLVYREDARVGDPLKGFRNEAMLVAMKPPV